MSITPAPPNRTPQSCYADSGMLGQSCEVLKTPGRRKQSFPTKTPPVEDVKLHDGTSPVGEMEGDQEYVPDFTGNSPWCNLQIVKAKVSLEIRFVFKEQFKKKFSDVKIVYCLIFNK